MRLDDAGTWPAGLLDYLNAHHDGLRGYYHDEKEAFDAYTNQTGRYRSLSQFGGSNPFFYDREAALVEIPKLLNGVLIRGWHCTRLTAKEIEDVKREGLLPLSPGLLRYKIERVVAEGLISKAVGNRLIEKNSADEQCRTGQIHFCLTPPRYGGEHGLEVFFRWWGGEAMVRDHLYDQPQSEVKADLEKVGIPCLVEADFPAKEFRLSPSSKIIYHYLASRGFSVSEPLDEENHVACKVPAANIKRVIEFPDPEFIALTGVDGWREPLITSAGGERQPKKHKGKGKSQPPKKHRR